MPRRRAEFRAVRGWAAMCLLATLSVLRATGLRAQEDDGGAGDTSDSDVTARAETMAEGFLSPAFCYGSLDRVIADFQLWQRLGVVFAPPPTNFSFCIQPAKFRVFDPTGFPAQVLSGLVPESYRDAVYVYRISVGEDPITRERVIYNACTNEIWRQAAPVGYDPWSYLRCVHPWALQQTTPEAMQLRARYDPARVRSEYLLLPMASVPDYALCIATAALANQTRMMTSAANAATMMNSFSPASDAFVITDLIVTGGGADVEIHLPDGGSCRVDLFCAGSLPGFPWTLVTSTPTNTGTFRIQMPCSFSNAFFQAGNADQDSDRDGIPDDREILMYGTDPNKWDTDGDGLSDYAELFVYHTNPLNPDTDGDGMPDGWEVANGFNPTNSADAALDADNDGLTNLQEFQYGTNPHSADTDGDGLPDLWEIQHGLNPLDPSDALADPDGDGYPTIYEYRHGTDPFLDSSFPTPNIVVTNGVGSIQDAINRATNDYDIVALSPGTYVATNWDGNAPNNVNLNFAGNVYNPKARCNTMMLIGTAGPSATIIDLQPRLWILNGDVHKYSPGNGFVCDSGETRAHIVSGITFRHGTNYYGGSGFSCQNASPTIAHCVFQNCFGSLGGTIAFSGGSPAISDCTLNTSSTCGLWFDSTGTLVVANSTICSNTAGGVYLHGSAIFDSVALVDNQSAYYGGGLYVVQNGNNSVQLTNCTVQGNSSAIAGGGVYASGVIPAFFDSSFAGNSAPEGGGLHLAATGAATVVNCNISSNQSGGMGGGVYLSGAGVFDTVVFADNQSASYGGGLCFEQNGNSTVQVRNCRFEGNSAAEDGGGGIAAASDAIVVDSQFVDNTAVDKGGGLWFVGPTMTMSNDVFFGNSSWDGGGVRAEDNSSFTVADCVFQSNYATDNGGALYGSMLYATTRSTCAVVRCAFADNTTGGDGSVVWWNAAAPGNSLSLVNCYAGVNAARSTVYVHQLSTALVQNCTFVGNTNGSNEGTIYNYQSSNTVVRNTILWNNTVAQIVSVTNHPGQAAAVDSCCISGGFAGASGIVTNNPCLSDGYRLLYGYSPCIGAGNANGLPDTDLDGNPRLLTQADIGCGAYDGTDSDQDGLPDAWEMANFGTLAYGPGDDPDGDGFTNLQEYYLGTSPVSDPDTDGDGLPDVYEIAHGLNPNDPTDAAKDQNGDGISNLDEYMAGAMQVRVTVSDPSFIDDSWGLFYKGVLVASCGSWNGFIDSEVVTVVPGTSAMFTLQRSTVGQWGDYDCYQVSFEVEGCPGVTPPWIAAADNSPLYGPDPTPSAVGSHWTFVVPQNQLRNKAKQDANADTTEPISTINGDISQDETDLSLPCPGFDLDFTRRYDSRQTNNLASLGPGWTHSFAWTLTSVTNSAYANQAGDFQVLRTGKGDAYWFRARGDGSFDPPPDAPLTLDAIDNGFRIAWPAGTLADFSTNGLMTRLDDGFGVGMSLGYDQNRLVQVAHDNGRTLAFSYSGGLLARVDVDPPANEMTLLFFYDPSNRLAGVTRLAGTLSNTTGYAYENVGNALTQRVNAAGHVYAYGVACYTNTAPTGAPVQMIARGVSMALNGYYYSHTVAYTNPGGFRTRVTYNRGASSNTLDYSYDPLYMRLEQITGPGTPGTAVWSNTLTRFSYDPNGNIVSNTVQDGASGESLTALATYDTSHNVLTAGTAYGANAVPGWTVNTWNSDNTLASATDPTGHRTEIAYTNGNPLVIRLCTAPGVGYETRFAYTAAGLLAAVTNANGHGLANEYDGNGYFVHIMPGLGPDTTFVRDDLGRVTATIQPGDNGPRTNAFSLDGLGRLLSATRPDGRSATVGYDSLGNPTNLVDFAGRTNVLTWLPAGHLQSSTRWLGSTKVIVSNYFDRQFNSLKITDPLGRAVETYGLDAQDRPVTVTNVEGRTMIVNYGVGDRILSIKRFDGSTVSNFFDFAGRLAVQNLPGGNGAYTYINNTKYTYSAIANGFSYYADGTMASATNYAGTVSNIFDTLNRLAWTTGAVLRSAVAYTYYPAGQVSNMVSVAGTNTWLLDAADRVSRISCGSAAPSARFVFAYNPSNGFVSSISNLSSGLLVTYRYDVLDRVTNILWQVATNGAVVRSFAYKYDLSGNVTNIAREAGSYSRGYTYDSLDRLTVETTNLFSVATAYDLAGNRTNRAGLPYTYATTNGISTDRLTGIDSATLSYDGAGNVTNILCASQAAYHGVTNLLLRWNGAGQLQAAITNRDLNFCETYGYDGLGRRAWTTVSHYFAGWSNWRVFHVYDGQHVIADLDEQTGATNRTYTYGPGTDNLLAMTVYTGSTSRTYFTIRDHQNTVWALTDTNGVVVESYDFDAWGKVVSIKNGSGTALAQSALGNRYLFQGREYSWVTGLYYFRARWYDPVTGRWLSPDPIGISGGLDQYMFCANNPVNFRDPFGTCGHGLNFTLEMLGLGTGGAGTLAGTVENVQNGATGLWVGRNGQLLSTSWGGNGATGGRLAFAGAIADVAHDVGTGAGLLGVGISAFQGFQAYKANNSAGVAQSVIDAAMGGVGFIPNPIAYAASGGYFLGQLIDHSTGASDYFLGRR